MGIFLYEEVMPRHLERRPVILSAAKDLCVRGTRSFAALRMTGRIARTSAHGRSSLHMSGGSYRPLTLQTLSPKIFVNRGWIFAQWGITTSWIACNDGSYTREKSP